MDDLLFSYAEPSTPRVKRHVIRLIEKATGQPYLKRLYLEHQRVRLATDSFFDNAIRMLNLNVQFEPKSLQNIPSSGAVVIVANHPYGVLDGIVISWLVERVRKDFLVLTNAVLLRAPEIQDHVLAVDFAPTPEAMATNLASRAKARAHLDAGGAIVVFPAGAISTTPDKLGRKPAVDATWGTFTANLIQRCKAPVVPIWFSGQNSRLFQIASHLSMSLRLSLVFHEVRSRVGTVLPLVIGAPIPYSEISDIKDRQTLMDSLRARTYGLAASLCQLGVDVPQKRRAKPIEMAARANLALKNLIERKRARL